jgi:hypothetical protein
MTYARESRILSRLGRSLRRRESSVETKRGAKGVL